MRPPPLSSIFSSDTQAVVKLSPLMLPVEELYRVLYRASLAFKYRLWALILSPPPPSLLASFSSLGVKSPRRIQIAKEKKQRANNVRFCTVYVSGRRVALYLCIHVVLWSMCVSLRTRGFARRSPKTEWFPKKVRDMGSSRAGPKFYLEIKSCIMEERLSLLSASSSLLCSSLV